MKKNMQMLPHASLTERTPQLVGQGMQNETKAKNAAWELLDARSPLEAQSRGNVAKGNTRAKHATILRTLHTVYVALSLWFDKPIQYCRLASSP